ncbi:PH domain-containing protein [Mucilaginibacter paludis]|uniref:Membrane-flanked domain DUF304 n=1 Tax=Mucilaginibacter paludis DSM 18603 TaxID=714943 RepID=H1YI49_9SPHI|nr:PH domain-containing protein [Mucilaginibacter paludis]EHQ26484.1 membrane-flanked domain DUF304 [Mucilaginibacter paludis DSM 18603]
METLTFRPHPFYALAKTAPVLLIAALVSILGYYIHPLFILPGIATCLYGWYRYFYICAIKYVLDAHTLQTSCGLFNKRIDSLALFRIKDYVITQSLLMRITGLMNMTLISTDMTNNTLTMYGIDYHPELVDQLGEAIRAARQNNKILELS